MNILLFVSKAAPPTELVANLEHAGHLVRNVANARGALELIARDAPDICVVSMELAGNDFQPLLKAVLRADDVYRAVVALVAKDTAEQRTALYGMGVDDVIGSGATAPELPSRIRSIERIVRLERRLRERVRELESALSRLEMNALRRGQTVTTAAAKGGSPADPVPFLLAPTWNKIEEILTKMCGEYLQAPFELVAGTAPPSVGSPGATVPLMDVEHELRLDVSFYSPPASAKAIAAAFCGDASLVDDDVIRDVILELANSAMGAIKSAFAADGYRFAASIPKAKPFADLASLLADVEAKRVLTFRSSTSFVHVIVAVRRTARKRVKATELREGMVIAADIVGENGALIMKAGNRLTETAADRIRRLAPKLEVELADPT